MTTSPRPNLASVAREAGVAVSTVSLVLNGKAGSVGIAADTILRVRSAADKLGYMPNQQARSLRRQRSGLLGIVLSGVGNEIPARIMGGVRSVLDQTSPELEPLMTSHDYDSNREQRELRFLMRNQVEAVIATPVGPYERNYAPLVAAGIPLVFVMHGLEGAPDEVARVLLDSSEMARMGVQHLVEGGARRIAYLAWDYGSMMSREKLAGVQRGMREFAAETTPAGMFVQNPGTSFEASLDALFASKRTAPDALLCNPFSVAVNCLDYLDRKGISVPDDCALLSLNEHPVFGMERIGISAIAQDTAFIGRRAAEVALAQIGAKRSHPVFENHAKFEIISRATTRRVR